MDASARPRSADAGGGLCFLACVGLLLAGAAVHLWYLIDDCPLDLSGDEAHYWEWARHLDLSYYSKGPLVAWIIALARHFLAEWSQRLLGHEALAVRVPAVVLSLLTGLGIYTLAAAVLRRPWLALGAVALTFSMPILAAGALLMTIDAPLACAWVWALVCVEGALRRNSLPAWVLTGVLIGVGILAKYTMVLIFPVVGLLILTEPALRVYLKRPGPYLATLIGLTGLLPILFWNTQHNWVSFRHVAGQAGLTAGPRLDLLGPLNYLAGQLAVVGLWFPGMLIALVEFWRRPRIPDHERQAVPVLRLLLCAAAVPWLVFLLFSPITKIQPNWPMLSLIPATVLLPLWLSRCRRAPRPAVRRRARAFLAVATVLGASMVVAAHRTDLLLPLFDWLARGAPPLRLTPPAPPWELTPIAKYDPTARLRGWSELGRAVGELLEQEQVGDRNAFILTDDYQVASEIAFYCPGEPTVYCAQAALGNRLSQYDLWPNPIRDPGLFLGRPCVYVGRLHPALTGQGGRHAALPGLGEPARIVEHRVRGHVIQIWSLFVCDRFAGFEAPGAMEKPKY